MNTLEHEAACIAIRAQGPGGQNVNKVSNAVHLRFDVRASALLSDEVKARLLALPDRRIGKDGVIVIKAQSARSLALNKAEAMARLRELIDAASQVQKARKATQPSYGSRQRRLQGKALRGQVKQGRGKVAW